MAQRTTACTLLSIGLHLFAALNVHTPGRLPVSHEVPRIQVWLSSVDSGASEIAARRELEEPKRIEIELPIAPSHSAALRTPTHSKPDSRDVADPPSPASAPAVPAAAASARPVGVAQLTPQYAAELAYEHASATPADTVRASDPERRLNAMLRRDASERSFLHQRETPTLRRLANGGYEWKGHAFTARIDPAGEVRFEDRPDFEYAGLASPDKLIVSPLTERAIAPGREFRRMYGGLLFRFDLTDLLERGAGNDVYSVERLWFLGHTEALRKKLSARHALCSSADSARLRSYLRSLSQASAEQVRREVLDVIDACSSSPYWRQVAEVISQFIRSELSPALAAAFHRDDLEALNQPPSHKQE